MNKVSIKEFLAWIEPHAGKDKGANQWEYLLGTNGQILTADLLKRKAHANYDNPDAVISFMTKFIGRYVTDCNGLPEWFLHLKHGGNFDTKAKYNYATWCSGYSGTDMKKLPQVPGTAVFKWNVLEGIFHVGFLWKKYGAGQHDWYVFEASGYRAGVVVSRFSGWNRWGQMRLYFDYDTAPETFIVIPPTIHMGSKGANVQILQVALNKHGAKLSVDGDFGIKTDAAVREYQKANNLEVDGVVGRETWTSLLK